MARVTGWPAVVVTPLGGRPWRGAVQDAYRRAWFIQALDAGSVPHGELELIDLGYDPDEVRQIGGG